MIVVLYLCSTDHLIQYLQGGSVLYSSALGRSLLEPCATTHLLDIDLHSTLIDVLSSSHLFAISFSRKYSSSRSFVMLV